MKSGNLKYFITGGGTGGHIYPAVAVADYLSEQTRCSIHYIGNPKNLEFDIVANKKYDFLPVNISGMPRKAGFELFKWFVYLILAIMRCIFYIMKYKPDVVFGTGGYVSAPVLFAAKLLDVPYVLHDCDSNPGLVTRSLASGAKSISLAFDCARYYIDNENCFVNGNPLREGFKTLSKEAARNNLGLENKLTICVMGGSQGAASINSATVDILKTLSKDYNVQVIFQTGKKKYQAVIDSLSAIYPEFEEDKNILVKPYFEDMISVLKASDIAVSRAGSLSISELCASGIAVVYVPYPHAAADHQRKNAKYMLDCGAGLYVEDEQLNSGVLLDLLLDLINDNDKLVNLQNSALSLAKYDGVTSIVRQIRDAV